jgi:diaminopimelate decarboxylase
VASGVIKLKRLEGWLENGNVSSILPWNSTPYLKPTQANQVASAHGTPCFVYDEATLITQAQAMLAFPNAFGLTVRFAMKACPNSAILRLFAKQGLYFDASSGWEVRRAIKAGVSPEKISLSS